MLTRLAMALVLVASFTTASEARGWLWFVTHIKAGDKCPGTAVATTMYGEGRRNADGSRFNPSGLSAASWDFPFGTVLRVTNCWNGRSVNVVVKDRGPAKYQRGLGIKLDLSTGAAHAIALGQQGRFESGYTSYSVVSRGETQVASVERHSRRHSRRFHREEAFTMPLHGYGVGG